MKRGTRKREKNMKKTEEREERYRKILAKRIP
jgi:hypothetical protein